MSADDIKLNLNQKHLGTSHFIVNSRRIGILLSYNDILCRTRPDIDFGNILYRDYNRLLEKLLE